jgi:ElaB/YqjD/DUF883 family membrane-anchored ribosome-binding protein
MTSTTGDRRADASASNRGTASGGTEDRGRLSEASRRAAEAYQAARERTSAAYASAGRRTSESIDANPLVAVAGGLALGAILGALLPRTDREEKLLGPAGRRINDTARQAANAARDAGRQQLDELGLSRDGLRSRLDGFTDKAVSAVRTSAGAAAGSVKTKAKG